MWPIGPPSAAAGLYAKTGMAPSAFVALVIAASLAACHSPMQIFPNDVDGDVLRRMQAHGDDLSKPRDIDFEYVFLDEQNARGFADEARTVQVAVVKISRYDQHGVWQTTVTKQMLPTHDGIVALKQALSRLAHPHGGKFDGWGSWQVNKSK